MWRASAAAVWSGWQGRRRPDSSSESDSPHHPALTSSEPSRPSQHAHRVPPAIAVLQTPAPFDSRFVTRMVDLLSQLPGSLRMRPICMIRIRRAGGHSCFSRFFLGSYRYFYQNRKGRCIRFGLQTQEFDYITCTFWRTVCKITHRLEQSGRLKPVQLVML